MTLNTRVTDDQLGQYCRKTVAIADRLGKSLSFDDVMSALQRIHDGQFEKIAPPKPVGAEKILVLVNAHVEFEAIDTHDPYAFFKTRTGLQVSDEFWSRILSKAVPVKKLAATVGMSYDLTQKAYDRDITSGLSGRYAFLDESEMCARIAAMLQKQPDGEKGDLLNNGYANLFYVAGYVVGVRWYADRRGWYVRTWELCGGRWRAGDRVFSRN